MTAISIELRIALVAVFLITVLYRLLAQNGIPESSSALGYGLGIVGVVLMLGAEVLHTWRKAQKGASQLGKIKTWLQGHIIIGLLGPYLVLLHSAWGLNGVAGAAMLLAFLMVASGFLCNYIYPSLPRNVEGAELSLPEIEGQIAEANARLQAWESEHPAAAAVSQRLADLPERVPGDDALSVLGRAFLRWSYQRQLRTALQQLQTVGGEPVRELEQLYLRRYLLKTQIHSLAAARKLLGQARAFHIVVGVVLFAVVFVHIGAALYYATFAH